MSVSPNSTSPHYDCIALNRYLESELSSDEQDRLETHLNDCVMCLQKLEQLAADNVFWTESLHALKTNLPSSLSYRPTADLSFEAMSSLAASSHCTSTLRSAAGFDTDRIMVGQARMLERWLDPTERPDSLGRIGKYEVLGIAGHGGMGLVLKAFDTELERIVGLKTMTQHVSADANARSRLAREARAVASLRHPNVISIFGLETWRDVPFIVMPFVSGGTLQQFACNRMLNTTEVIQTALQIASALSALHAFGIIHRDLKPSNILLQDELDHLLLSDFGLATHNGEKSITQTDAMAGTPFFMSPEQAMGKAIDSRSDLFSFGSVLFWLCTGEYPFKGGSTYETLSQLVQHPHDPERLSRSQVPNCLQIVIHRLLAKDPLERWSNIEQVKQWLDACAAFIRNPSHPLPQELLPPHGTKSHRLKQLSSLAAGLIALTIVLIVIPWETYYSRSLVTSATSTDDRVMLDDLKVGKNLSVWLDRLASRSVNEIPVETLPMLQLLSDHPEPHIKALCKIVLDKNPFQEVPNSDVPFSELPLPDDLENPFQEVMANDAGGKKP